MRKELEQLLETLTPETVDQVVTKVVTECPFPEIVQFFRTAFITQSYALWLIGNGVLMGWARNNYEALVEFTRRQREQRNPTK